MPFPARTDTVQECDSSNTVWALRWAAPESGPPIVNMAAPGSLWRRALDNSLALVIVCERGVEHSNHVRSSGRNRYTPDGVLNGCHPSLASDGWICVMKMVHWNRRLCLASQPCCSALFSDPGGDLVPTWPIFVVLSSPGPRAEPFDSTDCPLLTFLVRLQQWLMVIRTFSTLVSFVDSPHPSGLHVRLTPDTCALDPPGLSVPGLFHGERPKLFLSIEEQRPCPELAARSFCYLGKEVQSGPQT